jgi:hypothetical protein
MTNPAAVVSAVKLLIRVKRWWCARQEAKRVRQDALQRVREAGVV